MVLLRCAVVGEQPCLVTGRQRLLVLRLARGIPPCWLCCLTRCRPSPVPLSPLYPPRTRALLQCQLALKAGKFYTSVTNMCVWGNHSTTQVPDFVNAKIGGKRTPAVIRDEAWLKEQFTPTVANRGGALIKKWGRSSAASTAVSVADHLRSLYTPTPAGDCFSTAIYTAGNPYGIDGTRGCRGRGRGGGRGGGLERRIFPLLAHAHACTACPAP